MSNSFWPHGLRHARLACSSPAPGVCSNACLLSWWCHSTISSLYFPCSPTFKFSQCQGLFQWFSLCIRWPKYWSFSSSISPSNEHSRLISFRMDWLDLLAVQGTLKSLLQGEGGMFRENSMYIIYSETDHQPRWDAWDKCLGLVHWEDPEGSGGEGGGRGNRDGEHM